jgi:hypothetical protein
MKTASEGRQSCLILPAVSLEGGPLASKGGTVRDLRLTARRGTAFHTRADTRSDTRAA